MVEMEGLEIPDRGSGSRTNDPLLLEQGHLFLKPLDRTPGRCLEVIWGCFDHASPELKKAEFDLFCWFLGPGLDHLYGFQALFGLDPDEVNPSRQFAAQFQLLACG